MRGGQLSPEGGKPPQGNNSQWLLRVLEGGLMAGIEVNVREPKPSPKKGRKGRQRFTVSSLVWRRLLDG